jgi:hypothetical protein
VQLYHPREQQKRLPTSILELYSAIAVRQCRAEGSIYGSATGVRRHIGGRLGEIAVIASQITSGGEM